VVVAIVKGGDNNGRGGSNRLKWFKGYSTKILAITMSVSALVPLRQINLESSWNEWRVKDSRFYAFSSPKHHAFSGTKSYTKSSA